MHPSKADTLQTLYTLLYLGHNTIPDAAMKLGVSEYQVRQLKKSPEFADIVSARRSEQLDDTAQLVSDLGPEIINVMRDLMYNAKSDFVKFNAAKQLGDWMGLATQQQATDNDDRSELGDFLKTFLDHHDVTIHANSREPRAMPIVQANGLLPEFTQDDQSWSPDWSEGDNSRNA